MEQQSVCSQSVLYYNGTILTMDDDCPMAEAVLVSGGRIKARGTMEELSAQKEDDTVLLDLEGRTMLPGFIDGHSHFSGLATSLTQCDLSEASDFEDIVRLLRSFIEKNRIPQKHWVVGVNYDHNFLAEKCHPDKFVLDRVSRVHPVAVIHASSHMGVANSVGLEQQGITQHTENPQGGRYGRVNDTQEPDGYMEENAFVQFRSRMPMPGVEEILKLFGRAQEVYASYGITTVQEGMVTAPLYQILKRASQKEIFYLDLVGYADLEHREELFGMTKEAAVCCAEQKDLTARNGGKADFTAYGGKQNCLQHADTGSYHGHFRIGGYKIFLDGSPQGRTAWMLEPYEAAMDGYCGYPVKTDEQVYDLILQALKDERQLLAHCNGDAAAQQYIAQFERVRREYPKCELHRPVMVHAQLVRAEQLDRMKALSMMPSFFTAHTYYWGDIHIQNFGMERAGRISPAGTALRLGLPFTFHQDSPVLQPDVFRTIWCAVKRMTKSGVQLAPEERISVYDALKAMTVYGAYQYGEENEKGTIRAGKLADLIIVDRNPLTVPADEVKDIKVLETIKEGRSVYKRAGKQ